MHRLFRTLAVGGALLGGATLMALRPASPSTIAASPSPELGPGMYEVDPGHTGIVFSIMHLGVTPFYGRFNKVGGAFVFGDDLSTSSVRIEIDAASVDTNSSQRDDHLRSPDFFNAKQYPQIVFESSKIEAAGGDMYKVTGELRLHGKSKEITVPMQFHGEGDQGPRFGYRAGFSGEFTFDRTEFGMSTYADTGTLGSEIRVMLGVEGKRK